MDPEARRRRRQLNLLKERGCGCKSGKICKHYYTNIRSQVQRAESVPKETSGQGDAATPPVQTYFDDLGVYSPLITPGDGRIWKLMDRKRQRLKGLASDSGSAQGSRRRAGRSRRV